jgi:hypothetical protein
MLCFALSVKVYCILVYLLNYSDKQAILNSCLDLDRALIISLNRVKWISFAIDSFHYQTQP